jgi:hypothetical protein
LLTIILAIFLLDDKSIECVSSSILGLSFITIPEISVSSAWGSIAMIFKLAATVIIAISNSAAIYLLFESCQLISRDRCTLLDAIINFHSELLRSFFLGSRYGLFAFMTKERNELILEVSEDDEKVTDPKWYQIKFRYKPGVKCESCHFSKRISLTEKISFFFSFFHMPRLDWLMWFLAFKKSKEEYPKWFWNFLASILEEDNKDVMYLMDI